MSIAQARFGSRAAHHGPLAAPGLGARVAPFAAAAVITAFTTALPVGEHRPVALGLATMLTLTILVATPLVPWHRLPADAQAVPPLAFFFVLGLTRHGLGGVPSGMGPLTLLPVFWFALHGTRRQLWVSVAGAAIVNIAPVALIGGTRYPASEWRRVLILITVAHLIGVAVQRLVATTRRERDDLALIGRVLRSRAAGDDSRPTVCAAARTVTGASAAVLLEVADGGTSLVRVAADGVDLGRARFVIGREPSGAAVAATSHTRFFVPDAAGHPALHPDFLASTGAVSALFEPITRGGEVIGVLSLAFTHRVEEIDPRVSMLLELLAVEAALAIDNAALIGELRDDAIRDSLTGLVNRRGWDWSLTREIAHARRSGQPLTIAVLDLDRFKLFNDTHGHAAGDRLLREVGALLSSRARSADVVARWGGEEFALALPSCTAQDAKSIVDRLIAAVPDDQSFSAGIATWDGEETATALLGRADVALYQAKDSGRARAIIAAEPDLVVLTGQ